MIPAPQTTATGTGRRLLPDVRRRCAEVAPEAEVRIAEALPVLGAGLLGLDWLGLPDRPALRRLMALTEADRGWPGLADVDPGRPVLIDVDRG